MTPQALIVFGLILFVASKVCLIANEIGLRSQKSEAALAALCSLGLILGGFYWWMVGAW